MHIAKTIIGPATATGATKAIQYVSRSKLCGLPFHAVYPITAAIDGATTKSEQEKYEFQPDTCMEAIEGEE
jgi:hypothetical protein